MNNCDTIFALSSATGKSGVAVIRVAGDYLHDMFAKMLGRDKFDARRAYFTKLHDDADELIDTAIMIFFAAPHSFTGSDLIEIQSHGAPAVITKIFDYLSAHGARMAMPGEFSRRAFINGKMDLADVDGLAALLDAQTDMQRKHALKSMMGGDSKIYDAWRRDMIEIAAYAVAMLDYADDELPQNIGTTIQNKIRELHNEINVALARYNASRAVRNGFNIVLAGDTNVGKSSIFNAIIGTNRAIVSDIAGTTRDVVSATIDIDGYLVNLMDTAGLRDETDDEIEKIGMERTRGEIENADLVIRVYAGNNAHSAISANEIIVINKCDLTPTCDNKNAIYTCARDGDGIDKLMKKIREKMHMIMDGGENNLTLNERTRGLLNATATELAAAISAGDNYDIIAEHVRHAADNVGKILGTITAADVMDATFAQLCLGK